MALSDKIELEVKSRRRLNLTYCAYQSLYDSLSKDDQKALDDAWARNLSVNIILVSLRSEGYKASNESIRAHRNGTCKCPKK